MNEDDYRLTALKTSYGTGTRSYARSAEKKEMDRQRKRITEEYQPGKTETQPVMCDCAARPWPHEAKVIHRQLGSDSDWRALWDKDLHSLWRPAV